MKLTRHKYRNYTEFLALRRKLQGVGDKNTFRLGASDVAKVYSSGDKIGLDEYTSPTVFFYECCDFYSKPIVPNLDMHRGKVQEQLIYKEYWRYFNPLDPTPDAYLDNYHGDKKVFRKAQKCGYILTNELYPWLFISMDYKIQKSKYSPAGPLELKSTSWRANQKYEADISPSYVIQNHAQMMVSNSEYGELFDVENATTPKLYSFTRSETIEKNIIESTKDFVDRVLKGKKIVHSNMPALEKEQALAEIAPPDDGSPLYTEFLKERHKPENAKVTITGTDEQLEIAVEYLRLGSEIKTLTQKKDEKENKIREFFRDTNIGTIEFPVGKINWFEKLSVQPKILENVA